MWKPACCFILMALVLGGVAAAQPPVRRVVVIGVDGLSPDGVRRAPTPHLDRLMARGAHTLHARGVLPTSSSTNWASMIMGAGPEQHGITSNGWERDRHVLPPVAHGAEALFPTIFGVLRAQRPEAVIAVVYHWKGFGRLFEKSAVDVDLHGESEHETARLAADVIRDRKPTLTFVHLDHVDGAGHAAGHGAPTYYAAVARADSLIGLIVDAVQAAGLAEETLWVVSSDHGGVGKGHGGETLEEIEIPFILAGPGVRRGLVLDRQVYTYDNAATVAFALGLEAPPAWIGRPVRHAFEGYPPPPLVGQRQPFYTLPEITPADGPYGPAGGLFFGTAPAVSLTGPVEATIRYTLDGSEPTAASPVYRQPLKLDRTAVVRARLFLPDGRAGRTAEANVRVVPDGRAPGLRYGYYATAAREALPDFTRLSPARTGAAWEFRLAHVAPGAGPFAVRFEGALQVDAPGAYTFCTFSDDGSKLYVAGAEVVDNDGSHGTVERCGTVRLTAGRVPLVVTYFNGEGGSWLDVYYSGPGVPRQIVPADRLYAPQPGASSSNQ